jgi:hypothetical protein
MRQRPAGPSTPDSGRDAGTRAVVATPRGQPGKSGQTPLLRPGPDLGPRQALQLARCEAVSASARVATQRATIRTGFGSAVQAWAPVAQRKVIARVRTRRDHKDLPRVISELRIEGRAPTNVKGQQGDHTVAETLINESVRREVMGMQPKLAMNNLVVLAHLTLPAESEKQLADIFAQHWNSMDQLEGEDQNTLVEEFVQTYIELANKRPDTAFLRDDLMTRGNKGERAAIGGVRELAAKLEQGGQVEARDLDAVATHLKVLVDMKWVKGSEGRYTDVVVRAIQHAVLSVLTQLMPAHAVYMVDKLVDQLGARDGIKGQELLTLKQVIAKTLKLPGA